MNKKSKNLLFVIIILVLLIIIYFVVKNNSKEEQPNNTEQIKELLFQKGTSFSNIKIANEKCNFEVFFDDITLKWKKKDDENFHINQKLFNSMISSISGLTYSRTITDFKNLEDFGLENPKVSFELTDKTGKVTNLLISSNKVDASGKTTYFMIENDNKIYISENTLSVYGDYELYDFCEVASVPVFSKYSLGNIVVSNQYTEKLVVFSGDDKLYYYNGISENEDKKHLADESDAVVFYNHLNEFKYNTVVSHNPSEDDLATYGLKNPQCTIIINFSGQGTYSGAGTETEFIYTLNIGNPVSENAGEYYCNFTCTEDGKDSYVFYDNSVYKINNIYAKYFINLSNIRLNGEYSLITSVLPENELPVLTMDMIKSIIISNSDGFYCGIHRENDRFTLIKDPVSYDKYDADQISIKQLEGYITQKDLFAFGSRIESNASEIILNKYGLGNNSKHIKIDFAADDKNGNRRDFTFELKLGNEYKDESGEVTGYYVTSSNSEYVFVMNKQICEYLDFIDSDYFSGKKIYK
ncbi:MAG: DUF4340 domain-containing protein [Clostridiales bacterium]|nr:DUF4340 domain-containing protein [Clostridiales bacterium]